VKKQKPLAVHLMNWLETSKELVPEEREGIFYPTKEQIISLHDFLINEFQSEGEPNVHPGLLNDGPLDFIGIKYYEENKDNNWENLIYKGAKLFNLFLEEGHPFIDGNKRTGFVTLWIFLTINNFNIKFEYLNYNDHYKKIRGWADINSEDNIYKISMWIKENETLFQKINRYTINFLMKLK
jgi:prophage maintenance system killer protein